jgi:hypothetical protein
MISGPSFTFGLGDIKQDTIRCMLLMSDTSRAEKWYKNEFRMANGSQLTINNYAKRTCSLVIWDYGYVVKCAPFNNCDWFYLNGKKKRLSSNMVVWQCIEIEHKQKAF